MQKKEIEDKILSFTNRETYINDLKSKLDSILIQVNQSAKEITTLRKQKALEFTNKVMEQLKSLYLEKVVFEIDFQKSSLQKKWSRYYYLSSFNKFWSNFTATK